MKQYILDAAWQLHVQTQSDWDSMHKSLKTQDKPNPNTKRGAKQSISSHEIELLGIV